MLRICISGGVCFHLSVSARVLRSPVSLFSSFFSTRLFLEIVANATQGNLFSFFSCAFVLRSLNLRCFFAFFKHFFSKRKKNFENWVIKFGWRPVFYFKIPLFIWLMHMHALFSHLTLKNKRKKKGKKN